LGHLGKFVVPGSYRIESNTGNSGGIEDVAFQNPDGSIVLLVLNSAQVSSALSVNWHGQSFPYTLPAGAVATFQWK
jgi:glucosylceramidase